MDSHSHPHAAGPATRDPVCGMSVDMAKTAHRTTHDGREIGFCSAGCKGKFEAAPEQYLTATDPVCGMTVDRTTAQHMLKHEGTRYYFCCEGCRTKFEADPAKYLNAKPFVLPVRKSASDAPSGQPAAGHFSHHAGQDHSHPHGHNHEHVAAPAGAKWTCPMHPEIVRDGPGDCPLCGMALEPMVASLDDGPNPELVDFTKRLWVSAALSIPILVLAMGGMVGIPVREWIGEEVAGW
ncbi:MAG: YHS domain-containing protein, partial [Devosia sp.]|nr:YHS domain-containing protein [Devosia sp.]